MSAKEKLQTARLKRAFTTDNGPLSKALVSSARQHFEQFTDVSLEIQEAKKLKVRVHASYSHVCSYIPHSTPDPVMFSKLEVRN